MPQYSKYVLVVDNVSSATPSRDIEKEFAYCGRVKDVVKDNKLRCALVEYYSAADASYAWRKMDGFTMDGRKWKVEWAAKSDFKVFGWKWTEDSPPPPPRRRYSRSRSPRSRSRSHSPGSPPAASRSPSRGRSRSPPRGDNY